MLSSDSDYSKNVYKDSKLTEIADSVWDLERVGYNGTVYLKIPDNFDYNKIKFGNLKKILDPSGNVLWSEV